MEFSFRTRAANLAAMREEPLDVLVVGGGIVGSWVALTAATRGLRTGLVEKGDFGSGTSGKTSRLIHGGLRYLEKYRVRLVREAVRERDVLLRIAPDLVRPLEILIPVYRGRRPSAPSLRLGLWVYDLLSREKSLPRRRWLSPEEVRSREPSLRREGLVGAGVYHDAIANDARLVLAVVRRAFGSGALVANYCRAVQVLRESGVARGVRLRDEETGNEWDVAAKTIVNATGPWVSELQPEARVRPTAGAHILLSRARLGHRGALYLPLRDGRSVFVLPWKGLTLVGTTDTDFHGDLDEVEAQRPDVAYLISAVNEAFPASQIGEEEVMGTYAGIRPLVDSRGAKESDVSRAERIDLDASGMITVHGGKFTTARAIARKVIRLAGRSKHARLTRSTATEVSHLSLEDTPDIDTSLREAVLQCARVEMALHVDDVLVRRVGVVYERPDEAGRIAERVAALLAEEFGWTGERQAEELRHFAALAARNRSWRVEGP